MRSRPGFATPSTAPNRSSSTIASTDSYRAARYGDIAILSNTRNPFPAFERGLADLGIPFVKDGGREFFSGREVQDILAALRVIDNPLDDVSLLAVLRSPLFGWGDRDLARVRIAATPARRSGTGSRGSNPKEGTADPSAYDTIRRLRQQAAFVPPVGLIELLCDVTAYRAALLCLPRGRAHVANIDKLIEFARATALLDGASLTSFLHRATLAEEYLGNESDAPASSVGDDAVVLSTHPRREGTRVARRHSRRSGLRLRTDGGQVTLLRARRRADSPVQA